MAASRVRVRPPHSHVGLLLSAAVFGALAGIPGGIWSALIFSTGLLAWLNYSLVMYNVIMLVIVFAPLLTFLLWLPRQCQHTKWVASAGAAFGGAMALSMSLIIGMSRPMDAFNELADTSITFAVTSAFTALFALLARFAHRTFFFVHIEQDGTLCNYCGYPMKRSGSAICPECGRTSGDLRPTQSERMIALCGRRNRMTMVALAVLLLSGCTLVWWHERDYRAFGRHFGEEWRRSWGLPFPMDVRLSTAVSRIADGLDDAVIVVELVHTPVWEPRRMYVRLGSVPQRDTAGVTVAPGEKAIFARVPSDAARAVLRGGPPSDVVARLIEAGRAHGWRPGFGVVEETIEVRWHRDN